MNPYKIYFHRHLEMLTNSHKICLSYHIYTYPGNCQQHNTPFVFDDWPHMYSQLNHFCYKFHSYKEVKWHLLLV